MAPHERKRGDEVAYLAGMARLAWARGFEPLGRAYAFEAECVAELGSGWRSAGASYVHLRPEPEIRRAAS